jgi:hypothetical protein
MKILLIALLFPVIGMGQGFGTGTNAYKHPSELVPITKNDTVRCKHIYVAVEYDTIFPPTLASGGTTFAFYEPQHGKDIVCVKCHLQKAQIIDYRIFKRETEYYKDSTGRWRVSPYHVYSVDTLGVARPRKQ